jgi:uncharacterized protein
MNKKFITLLLAVCSISTLLAQKDTIFFDAQWKITDRKHASFYRLPLIPSGKGFQIYDFYMSGKKQFEGISLMRDKDQFDGMATWFYDNGKIDEYGNYDRGILQGEFVKYDKQGNLIAKCIYKDDNPYEGSVFYPDTHFSEVIYYTKEKQVKAEKFDLQTNSKAKIISTYVEGTSDIKESFFYNQKGDFIGKLMMKDNEPYDGKEVKYTYNPMTVLSIQEISKGNYLGPKNYYYSNGFLKMEIYLNHDTTLKEINYSSDGKLLDSLLYTENRPKDGHKIRFYDNEESIIADKVDNEVYYRNGMLNGQAKKFFRNGKLAAEAYLKNDTIQDVLITYDSIDNKPYKLFIKNNKPWSGTYRDDFRLIAYQEGVLKSQTQSYSNGKPALILSDDNEIAYDTLGKEIGHLKMKEGEPYDGEKFSISNDEISYVKQYAKGALVKSTSYTSNRINDITEYKDGNTFKTTNCYSNGKPKQESYFDDNGNNNKILTYNQIGKLIGKFTINTTNGEIYDGDFYEFNEDDIVVHKLYKANTILRSWNYSDGQLVSDIQSDGNSYFYDHNNNKTYQCVYKAEQPVHGISVKLSNQNTCLALVNYRDGKKEGEAKFYDLNGKLLSTAIYKDDAPFQGTFYEYDAYDKLLTITQYKEGKMDGEQKYFDNKLYKLEFYENGKIVKTSTYKNDKTYELSYKDGEAENGELAEAYVITKYKDGQVVNKVEFADESQTIISTSEIYQNDETIKSFYFKTGQKKSEISYTGKLYDEKKAGKSTYYNLYDKIIATGYYKNNFPESGSFAFYSSENDSNYLVLKVSGKNFQVIEYINGQPGRQNKYENPRPQKNNWPHGEFKSFMNGIKELFSEYAIDDFSLYSDDYDVPVEDSIIKTND